MPSLKVRRSRTLGEFLLGRGMGVFFFFSPLSWKKQKKWLVPKYNATTRSSICKQWQ